MSAAVSVRVAPLRRRSLAPRLRGSSGEPGTAKTSRPCSSAKRAVISEPDFAAASTTTMPSAIPVAPREMAGLRLGAERQFGEDRAVARERLVKRAILLGVDHVDAARDDRDRARFERPEMRRRVDPAGQPGSD